MTKSNICWGGEKNTRWTNISCSHSAQISVCSPLVASSIPSPFPHFVISLKLTEGFTAFKLEIITVDSPHEEQAQWPLCCCCVGAVVERWAVQQRQNKKIQFETIVKRAHLKHTHLWLLTENEKEGPASSSSVKVLLAVFWTTSQS